jgi:hypothetical protein
MAGSRKFSLDFLSREDLASLTRDAAEVTGLPHVMDVDSELIDEILDA